MPYTVKFDLAHDASMVVFGVVLCEQYDSAHSF
jgi:hypothetical protein